MGQRFKAAFFLAFVLGVGKAIAWAHGLWVSGKFGCGCLRQVAQHNRAR